MIFGLHSKVVVRGIRRHTFRQCPAHEDAIAFESEVPMHVPRVMFLDDERVAVTGNGCGDRNRLGSLRPVAHAAVLLETVSCRRSRLEARHPLGGRFEGDAAIGLDGG